MRKGYATKGGLIAITITKEQLAAMLNGREYGQELTNDEGKLAKQSGLVVIFGASDDLMQIVGAECAEVGCYKGGTA